MMYTISRIECPPTEDRPIPVKAKKPPRKSLFLPLSPDTEIENVDDDSVTELPDLQVPVRISEIRRNVQLNVLAQHLQRRAQIKVYKR